MADDTPDRQQMTRRGVLALSGTAAVAGCLSIGDLQDSSEETIRAYDLPDVDAESVRKPIVAPSIPVDVVPSYFTTSRDRVNALLGELPTPMGPDDIPNGHVRQHLTDAAGDATGALDSARTARTELQAVQSLGEARERARYAAAGWAMATEGLSVESLREEHQQIVSDAHSFWDDHEYVGTDPVRAALVHARIEDGFGYVAAMEGPRLHGEGELLTVAEWGETVESALVTLSDVTHFDEQFTAALPEDADTVRDVLTGGAESLLADVRSRRAELPPEPTAEEWGVAENVISDLRRDLDGGVQTVDETRRPASAVVRATERLAKFRALANVQDRIDAGEITSVESAAELRQIRTTAHDALEEALGDSPDADLARTVLSDVSWRVTHADQQIGRIERDVRPERLDDVVEHYVLATEIARATPAACRQAVDALGEA